MRERREQILLIGEGQLLALITGAQRMTNVPEGALCIGAAYDFARRGFVIAVQHESFKPVPLGCEAPLMLAEFEMVQDAPARVA